MNTQTTIAGVTFKNPVMTASGTFGSGMEYEEFVDLNRLGAVVTKGVANVPWPGNPTPRVAEVYGGMLNAIGLQNPGIDVFMERDIPFLKKYDTKIIVNVCGKTVEDYVDVVERLGDEPAVSMLEINVSCPNVKEGAIAFGQKADALYNITSELKNHAKQPIIMKLSPNVTDITEMAKAAEAAGADALSLINTITGMKIDIHRRKFAIDMWIATDLAEQAKAGQFIGVYPKDRSTLLPRPISICQVSDKKDALRIVYRIAGQGTAEFSSYTEGDSVEILGTLGNGFPTEAAEGKKVFLMGGGIGIPPMLELARELPASAEKQIIVGYRDNQLFLKEDLEENGTVYIATEDGSVGTKGNVMNAIEENALQADVIFACGPMPMLRAIKKYAEEKEIKAYISLEEHMACGVGACLGCVVKTKEVDHHSHVHNARICTDGPVFDAEEVEI